MEEVTPSPLELEPKEKRKFWEAQIQAWQASGVSQAEYCRQNNLKMHQWWYWRKRISHLSDSDITFVPLNLSSDKMYRSGVNVVTPNGYRIEVDNSFDLSKLRQLVTAVRGL
jgi:hypothetical protein